MLEPCLLQPCFHVAADSKVLAWAEDSHDNGSKCNNNTSNSNSNNNNHVISNTNNDNTTNTITTMNDSDSKYAYGSSAAIIYASLPR